MTQSCAHIAVVFLPRYGVRRADLPECTENLKTAARHAGMHLVLIHKLTKAAVQKKEKERHAGLENNTTPENQALIWIQIPSPYGYTDWYFYSAQSSPHFFLCINKQHQNIINVIPYIAI